MAKKIIYGLMSAKMGPVAVDGGPGTVLTDVGYVNAGSFELTADDATITDFNAEQIDNPVLQVVREGKKGFTFDLLDTDADGLARVLGGTVTAGPPKVWNAPKGYVSLVQTLEFVTQSGHKLLYPRVQLVAKIAGGLTKDAPLTINIVGTVLEPEKANTAPLMITEPA